MTMIANIDALKRETAAGVAFLRRSGESGGLPLVLLHGIGGNAESWTAAMAALAPRFDAIAWDAPGYGESDPLAAYSPVPADYAAILERLLEAMGWRRIILAGHSLGCLFAGAFAAARPERVAALALLSPALGYRVAPGAPLPPNVQARIDGLERLGPATFAAKSAPRLVYRPGTKPAIVERVERAMAAVRPDGYAQAVRALGAGDLLADAPRIAAPTLVAVGTQDVVTPPANARLLYKALCNPVGFEEVPDSGHALPQEAPKAVAVALTRLVEQVAHV
ncbi:MAG TPA: alpha/beta hydrolase [Beijerinckiaceae bacterium]|nr:alpha/beta hydrolase [Beijerinckiaceae bacterium]